jgi:hypothetical protein
MTIANKTTTVYRIPLPQSVKTTATFSQAKTPIRPALVKAAKDAVNNKLPKKRFGLASRHFNLVNIKPAEKRMKGEASAVQPKYRTNSVFNLKNTAVWRVKLTMINIPHKNINSEDSDKTVSFLIFSLNGVRLRPRLLPIASKL